MLKTATLLTLLLWVGACSSHAATPAAEANTDSTVRLLQQRARALDLAGRPMWRKLLHYQQQPLTRRWRSLADDPDFFNASDGATNAEAELDATLAAFFDPTPHHALQQSAQCRFPARRLWLEEQLGMEAAGLPHSTCERYDAWLEGLDAQRISLIFPAAYINSPASMYGHTFLRADARGAQGQAHPLLSYAISYAADGNEAEGIAFAFKGLFGLYPGVFTNSPYYLKIRDYTHLENRDIWEYELALSNTEITRLLAHAWELGTTRFDYYFFDENCSYHLLSLIDVARPDLDLSSRFTWWAIPVDTVRAITETPGLLRRIAYRPSNTTELAVRAAALPASAVRLARELGESTLGPSQLASTAPELSATQQALTLELAERYLGYRTSRGLSAPEPAARERLALLTERAALPATPTVVIPVPNIAPERGHGTARTDLLAGRCDGVPCWQFGWRPAYHDLSDPDAGFQHGAQIQFFRIDLAQRRGDGVQLERLMPVDIVSLTPSDGLLSGSSWKVRFGLERTYRNAAEAAPLGLFVNGGPGRSWVLGRTGLAYAFVDNQLVRDPSLAQQSWALGSGPALGLLWDPAPAWRLQLDGWRRWHVGRVAPEQGAALHLRVALDHTMNGVVTCRFQQRAEARRRSCSAGLQRYW